MPQTPHTERHFTGTATVRDIVIGMSDGLTVPFALAAGLSGAVDSTGIIVTAGLAEIAAGSIAMGLGGYLAARVMLNITKQNGSERQQRSRRNRRPRLRKSPRYSGPTASPRTKAGRLLTPCASGRMPGLTS
jgi:VIT family